MKQAKVRLGALALSSLRLNKLLLLLTGFALLLVSMSYWAVNRVLTFIKCAQQLGFKLKEMQAILDQHRGQTLPWEVVSNAIARKKHAVMNQIEALQQVHAGLEEFETRFAMEGPELDLACVQSLGYNN
ncbi:MerR family DNA-binding protein [Pseudomonas fragi]|uniref:MerR family transcriptional regulator n=1 Tax=Pseudomonas fragi TaxID=296 RepID=A0A449IG83_PSEFR|nr:MerR family DNA-binding protein [Pseudomonas fragi]VFB18512.1 MerR family transcriptional regulator [Pseudomonas fragi]